MNFGMGPDFGQLKSGLSGLALKPDFHKMTVTEPKTKAYVNKILVKWWKEKMKKLIKK